ncbi:MAG: hypothetical protein KF753_19855 [Caldilineaceae bacterium]|nr:hypothetical protein [Caldilineaceae bacterium]
MSSSQTPPDLIWQVRTFIYRTFAETTQPPDIQATADRFHLSREEMEAVYGELERVHAFFLEPGTLDIRIANPFSAVPTDFVVEANGKRYWANCGWDALGIPAAMHTDAHITTTCAQSGAPIHFRVQDGRLAPTSAVVHFVVPFARWYEDMIFT